MWSKCRRKMVVVSARFSVLYYIIGQPTSVSWCFVSRSRWVKKSPLWLQSCNLVTLSSLISRLSVGLLKFGASIEVILCSLHGCFRLQTVGYRRDDLCKGPLFCLIPTPYRLRVMSKKKISLETPQNSWTRKYLEIDVLQKHVVSHSPCSCIYSHRSH